MDEKPEWWVYDTERPSDRWEGTEFYGPYTEDEADLVMQMMGSEDWAKSTHEQLRRYMRNVDASWDDLIFHEVAT